VGEMSVFDRPDFKEWELKHQEKQRALLESKGFELVNISHAFPWVGQIEMIEDIRPEYELRRLTTGERIGGIIDCNYYQALTWAIWKAEEIIKKEILT
jgi:hypothetical protein